MLRSPNWVRVLKRAILRESIERDTRSSRLEARRPRFEPLEDRRVMAVAIEAFTPTPSGFTAQLSEEIRLENLNLYDTQGGAMGAADVTLRGESGGDVRGTLVVRGTELTFVATGGVLAPDTYTATLRSAPDGIIDAALGQMLDGEFTGQFPSGDGVPGGDFVFSFTVAALPSVVVGLPDFARGPTQPVNVPAIGSGLAPLTGLPIRVTETAGVTSMSMTITYDPTMLDVSEIRLGRDAPSGSQVEANLTVPGQITLAFFSLNPMTGGPADLLEIVATVPEDAPYAQAQVLRVASLEVNAGLIQAVGDDAIHVVAFPGDANANRRYDAEDARLIARVGVGLDTGFVANNPTATGAAAGARLYPTIDPIIIGDVTGLDGISPLDASDILRRVVGLPTPNIPGLPATQAPTGLTLSSLAIAEGQPVGTTVGTFTTTDPDLTDTHTYSLVAGSGDTDNEFFTISGSSLLTTAVFDAAVKSSYSIRVQTTDSTGRSLQRTFTISVTQGNQAPTTIHLASSTVAENQPAGTVVGQLITTDPNANDIHTYTLVSGQGSTGNASFQIVGSTLVTAAPLNFEQQSSYSVRIRSTDPAGLFTEEVFVVTVTSVNEAPTAIALDSTVVSENRPAGTVVGNLSTTDPDAGDTHTYTLVTGTGSTDNASFAISGNTLVTAQPLDADQQNSYTVRIRSTDAGGLFTEQVFVITVTSTNEAPTAITLSNNVIAENEPAGTAVGSFTTTDPDAGDTHTYTLVAGGGDTDNAMFAISGNTLVTTGPLNFEQQSSYTVRVRSTDSGGLFTEQTFVITVTDVNEAPTGILIDSSTVDENQPAGTAVGTLTTLDPDAGDTHTYSIVAGQGDADNAMFAISGNTIVTTGPLNFEQQSGYSVRIRSTDAGGLFTEQVFVITATGTNEGPTAISLNNNVIAENQPAGTVVSTFTTTDPDAGDTHAYSMVTGAGDTDNAFFAIVNDTLITAQSLDFETQSSYSIRIRSTDSGGLFTEQVFVIIVTDVNEAPTGITLSPTTVDENQPAGTVVGTFTTADPDAGDTHAYSLVAGAGDADNASFAISGDTLITIESFDLSQQNSYTVRVRSTDSGGLFTEQVIVITVMGVNVAPTAISLDNTTVNQSQPDGTTVGTFTTTDPNAADSHSYSIVAGEGDADNASFAIVGNTLVIAEPLDFEQQSSYTVRVRSTDGGGLFTEQAFVITATDNSGDSSNQAPTAIMLDNAVVPNMSPAGTVIGQFSTVDPDGGTHQYQLVEGEGDTDNASFGIVNGELQAVTTLDFGATPTYSIRVRSVDEGGLFFEQVFLITEAPEPGGV
jgi:VCBS repeat-containing protein